jgi:transcriptional regulator with XRE-family HTH domain
VLTFRQELSTNIKIEAPGEGMLPNEDQEISLAVKAFKIGDKVRELRQQKRYTLQDLASKTGLSKPFLSQIENNRVIPPVATLLKLARGLDVNMSHFFGDEAAQDKISITRHQDWVTIKRRPHQEKAAARYIYTALGTSKNNKNMEPYLVEFPPQTTEEIVFMSHEGEEFLYIMEGRIEFRTIDRVEVLEPGDSIYIESDLSHSFRRISEAPARALAVLYTKSAK